MIRVITLFLALMLIISLAQSLDLFIRPFSGLTYVINQQIRKHNERIGTRKLMETNKFRLWEMILDPNQSSELHTHLKEYSIFVSEGSKIEVYDVDDNLVGVLDAKSGSQIDFLLDKKKKKFVAKQDSTIAIPLTHKAKNVGKSRFKELLIELKPN